MVDEADAFAPRADALCWITAPDNLLGPIPVVADHSLLTRTCCCAFATVPLPVDRGCGRRAVLVPAAYGCLIHGCSAKSLPRAPPAQRSLTTLSFSVLPEMRHVYWPGLLQYALIVSRKVIPSPDTV